MLWKVPTGSPMQLAKGVNWQSFERKRKRTAMGSGFDTGISARSGLRDTIQRKRTKYS